MRCGASAGWKCAGAGREQARFIKFLRVQGGAGLNFAGAGKKFQLAQDSNKYYWISSVRQKRMVCLLFVAAYHFTGRALPT